MQEWTYEYIYVYIPYITLPYRGRRDFDDFGTQKHREVVIINTSRCVPTFVA